MKVSEVFSAYLEAEIIPEGRDVTVTIESVRKPTPKDKGRDGRPIDKPIVRLAGKEKEWILNATNAKRIRRMHGDDMDQWGGKEITLYRDTCNAFGDPDTPCIRVRGKKL